jgi:hypothetical protein
LLTPEFSSGEIMLRSLSEDEVNVPVVIRLEVEFCVSGGDNSSGD